MDIISNVYSHVKLPFFKKILIGTSRKWLQLDFARITAMALLKGFQPVFLKEFLQEKDIEYNKDDININFRSMDYRGINLFEVTQYQIFVDLQIFKSDIDFFNPAHTQVIKKWFRRAAAFIDYILDSFQIHKYHKVIIFQGYLYESAILRWICIERGIQVVAVENTFNKDRIIWDNISGISVNKNLSRNFLWRYERITDPRVSMNYSINFIKNIKLFKQIEHRSPKNNLIFNRTGKTIFFIGQVLTDASTLFGINDFLSPVSIINELVQYVTDRKHTLIIKLHPKELYNTGIYNSLTHRKIIASDPLYSLIMESENIIYDHENNFNTYSIIRASDICVTINSQAGLEALLLGKNVITCGEAFYDCLKATHSAQNKRELIYLLDLLLKKGFDEAHIDEVYKFFYIFNEKNCMKRNEKSFLKLFFTTSII